jgi:glc operon protein GlcG
MKRVERSETVTPAPEDCDMDSACNPKTEGGFNMSLKKVLKSLVVLMVVVSPAMARAQQMASPYGPPVTLENAKRASAAAIAEAEKNKWTMAVAVVDPDGTLVYYEKMDNTQLGSAKVAINKARSAALYKRPTKAFQDALAAGGDGLRILGLEGAVPVEGGVPLVMDGKIVGAIGLSGAKSSEDAQCAQVGANALK